MTTDCKHKVSNKKMKSLITYHVQQCGNPQPAHSCFKAYKRFIYL